MAGSAHPLHFKRGSGVLGLPPFFLGIYFVVGEFESIFEARNVIYVEEFPWKSEKISEIIA